MDGWMNKYGATEYERDGWMEKVMMQEAGEACTYRRRKEMRKERRKEKD
jgi:hypothetical protein